MPRFDLERHANALQLGVSSFNALMLACGLLWAAAVFYDDSKNSNRTSDTRLSKAEDRIQKIESALIGAMRDGQEKTNARLTTLETQNIFIIRQLDRVEAGVARAAKP